MKRPKGFTGQRGATPPPTPPAPKLPTEPQAPVAPEISVEPEVSAEPDSLTEPIAVFAQNAEGSAHDAADLEAAPQQDGDPLAETIELFSEREKHPTSSAKSGSLLTKWRRPPSELDEAQQALKQASRKRRQRERKEQKRFTWAQRMRRRNGLIALSAVSVLVMTVLVGTLTPVMAVRDIDVQGAHRVPVEDITDALATVRGTPLALVDDERVRGALGSLELLESFEVDKVPPHTLRVVVRERQPVMAIPQGEEVRLLDAAGVEIDTVSQEERPEGIPLAKGVGENTESEEFVALAQTLQRIPSETRSHFREASANTPQQITFVLEQGTPVLWGDQEESMKKAFVLQAMLDALADTPVRSVDVSSPDAPVFIPE